MHTAIYKPDKQQGPSVWNKELDSISCNKGQWENMKYSEYFRISHFAVYWKLNQHYKLTLCVCVCVQ